MIHLIIVRIDQFRDGNQFIAFLLQSFNDAGKGILCIFGTVVHENNGTVPQMLVIQYP